MPLNNKELVECILKSTLNVVGRRTSDAYADFVINNSLKKLAKKYDLFKFVEIKKTEYNEFFDAINIKPEINGFEINLIGKAIKELMQNIVHSMGKNVGYYFIREIKESLSLEYDKIIKEIGVDLELLQYQYILERKEALNIEIQNDDVLGHLFMSLFEFLDKEIGRDSAYKNLREVVSRFQIEYDCLNYVKVNDVRAIIGAESIVVNDEVNKIESASVGAAIQKCMQELNNNFVEKGYVSFIEKFREVLNEEYIFKIESIGVDLDVIQYNHVLVIKHVIKALIDVLSDRSSETNSVLMINNLLRKFESNFLYFGLIDIDITNITDGLNAIHVSEEIKAYRTSEIGRGLQKIIEEITKELGEDGGKRFLEYFKKRLGSAYILKIEGMGVNLHMIELRRDFLL